MAPSILEAKRLLAVDDEPDVLDTLADLLEEIPGLILDRAADYDRAFHLMRSWTYDAVILDIMGVRGFDLLRIAHHRGLVAVMLTGHALNPEALKTSLSLGARAYIPKECMADIVSFLQDVLSLDHGPAVRRAFLRLGSVFNARFGSRWMEKESTFWDKVVSGRYAPEPVIVTKRP